MLDKREFLPASPVRAFAFNLVFYINMLVLMILSLPAFILPRQVLREIVKFWVRTSLWWLKLLVGTDHETRGSKNIVSGPLLVAAKHQSFWETFALLPQFNDPTIVLKRELTWIPLFGWYTLKYGCIAVDRDAGPKALRKLLADAKKAAGDGRQIMIYPEGTRREPGAAPDYKPGIGLLYSDLNIPCLPVALNSGMFWPRRRPERYAGTILVEFLPAIEPGQNRKDFLRNLQDRIEITTGKLIQETTGLKIKD